MKRLVYSPHIEAFIKGDDGVVDISPYIVSGSINRKVNQVSTAELVLRNPVMAGSSNLLFTENTGKDGSMDPHPLFHPMDPIIISMTRIQGHPVQVFTGYLDKSPYLQLYPGLCKVEASCTLKRLKYTQWDAALPWVQYFLAQFGWAPNPDTGMVNFGAESQKLKVVAGQLQGQFNDGSIGALLFAVLTYIGQWDASTIWIEALPDEIKNIVIQLYHAIEGEVQQGKKLFGDLITQILGSGPQGSGSASSSTGTGGKGGHGQEWRVLAGNEDDPPGAPGNCGPLPSDRRGYSVLSLSGTSGDAGTAGQALSAGGVWPCSAELVVTNPKNGKSATVKHVDIGAGSDSYHPIIGLYPGTRADLGITGNPYEVIIQAAVGSPIPTPVRGTRITTPSGTSNSATSKGGQRKATGSSFTNNLSLAPTTDFATGSGSGSGNAQKSGGSPGGKKGNPKNASPQGSLQATIMPAGTHVLLERTDMGVDFAMANGVPIGSPGAGRIGPFNPNFFLGTDGVMQGLQTVILDQPINGYHAFYVSEGVGQFLSPGTRVSAGTRIATSVSHGTGIEMGWGDGSGNPAAAPHYQEGQMTKEGIDFAHAIGVEALPSGQSKPIVISGTAISGSGPSGGGSAGGSGQSSANAAAFSTFINLPSIFTQAEAELFTGKRSFMADQPLFPFVEQLCQASLRNFMSMPNGNFFAFFPDYFGLFGRKYYWEIRDIEIMDGRIDLSDDPLVTHVGVAGDVTQFHDTIDVFDLLQTAGIFTIVDAFATGYVSTTGGVPTVINPQGNDPQVKTSKKTKAANKANQAASSAAINFLQTYGARPYVQQVPMIRSPFFELFLAFQNFMLLWSKQFETTFELTFMPELFPGGLVGLPDHHIQVYLEEVSHNFDYTSGFTTTVNVSSPSQLDKDSRANVSEGVARKNVLTGVSNDPKARLPNNPF